MSVGRKIDGGRMTAERKIDAGEMPTGMHIDEWEILVRGKWMKGPC